MIVLLIYSYYSYRILIFIQFFFDFFDFYLEIILYSAIKYNISLIYKMASAWNMFVKKIYWENKKKNKNFQFKDALKEASRRKGEMGSMGSMKKSSKKSKKMKGKKGMSMSMGMMGGKRSRKMRKSRKMRGGTGNAPSSSFGKNASSIDVQMEAGNAA